MQRSHGRRPLVAVLATVTLLLASACSGGSPEGSDAASTRSAGSSSRPSPDDPTPSPEAGSGKGLRYVALGDSYTAAPLVPTTDLQDPCLASTGNYPHRVSEARTDIELVDVSCGSADTSNMTEPQEALGQEKPPQFDALTDDTDLVTVGIGANDFNLFGALIYQCVQLATSDPDGAPCQDAADEAQVDPDQILGDIQANVEAVIEGIEKRAPRAQVLVVTYPQILPDEGICPDVMPLARGDYPYALEVNQALSAALVSAAEATGVEYVDVYAASAGHDVCSDDPWVNGQTRDPESAAEYHPFPEEQQAVADLILKQL